MLTSRMRSPRGETPSEASRAFGSLLRRREESRDIKLAAWLDSLRSDVVFGWRQLSKNKSESGAAVVSLALAIGACIGAFRLIDAMLLRPLPVAEPAGFAAAGDSRGAGGSGGDVAGGVTCGPRAEASATATAPWRSRLGFRMASGEA